MRQLWHQACFLGIARSSMWPRPTLTHVLTLDKNLSFGLESPDRIGGVRLGDPPTPQMSQAPSSP